MNRFFSIILHRNKARSLQRYPKNQAMQKHWEDVMSGKKKSFLPIPDEVKFGISIEEITGLRQELNEIHKRLSTLELKKCVG
jgi:hypothetical protein